MPYVALLNFEENINEIRCFVEALDSLMGCVWLIPGKLRPRVFLIMSLSN